LLTPEGFSNIGRVSNNPSVEQNKACRFSGTPCFYFIRSELVVLLLTAAHVVSSAIYPVNTFGFPTLDSPLPSMLRARLRLEDGSAKKKSASDNAYEILRLEERHIGIYSLKISDICCEKVSI
jgi:hypothetical protein